MLARLARVLLVVALLAGWQGALLHPLKHFGQDGTLVHLADGHSSDRDAKGSRGLCDALAALIACAVDTAISADVVSSDGASLFDPPRTPRLAEAPPFLSQGPPALL